MLEAHAFEAARLDWTFRSQAFIWPARQQIYNDHHPTLDDLTFVVQNNPFVPPDHEKIFVRGLHAGFDGDLMLASHLLVPQIENSIRYVLESNGIDVSNLNSDGTQPVKVLGKLLCMHETEEIIGLAFCFELKGHLIEKNGYDFRNRVAHGFVSDSESSSEAALNVWWLVLRLCLTPLYPVFYPIEEDVVRPESNTVEEDAPEADSGEVSPQ